MGLNIIKKEKDYFLPASILISAIIIAGSSAYNKQYTDSETVTDKPRSTLEEVVLPSEGFTLPIRCSDLGIQMIEAGVIDKEKFLTIYENRGGTPESEKKLLERADNGKILMTPYNANFILNLFWGLGLGNQNEILEKGQMMDKQYGGAGNFASTGGWSLAKGQAMDHYSMHKFMNLNSEQQAMVE